ncbi:hypothetical protein ACIPQA_09545 [Streptomyces sp. NPDC090109]|uniref:hypothetical protein n=1 Tax=Streptomyces sp. NPDC090109 TaxID=3365948 RepID=UPI003819ADE0
MAVGPGSGAAALRWIDGTLASRPGCLAAAVALGAGGCLVGLRDGRVVEATGPGGAQGPERAAAVVYAYLRAGLPLTGTASLRVDGRPGEDFVLRVRAPEGTTGRG